MSTLDPFADWAGIVEPIELSNGQIIEPFSLPDARIHLATLPPEPGHWPNPASLSRFFDPPVMDMKMLKRFEIKIKPTQIDYVTPCWLWDGGTHDKGYGRFWLGLKDNKRIWAYAHRISFEHWIGMPPIGYIVDHKCNHKLCCNPTHLWPETNNNNLRLADERRPWKRRNQYSQE